MSCSPHHFLEDKMTALSTLQDLFRESTGRKGMSDSRVNYFINAAIRRLNESQGITQQVVLEEYTLTAEAYQVQVTNAFAIKSVFIESLTAESYSELPYLPFESFQPRYPEAEETTIGVPSYWSYERTMQTSERTINVILMPPAAVERELRLYISRTFAALSDASDSNVWTVTWPDLVILMSMYVLEVHYRNFEGAKAIWADIQEQLLDIDKRVVERDMNLGNVMELAERTDHSVVSTGIDETEALQPYSS